MTFFSSLFLAIYLIFGTGDFKPLDQDKQAHEGYSYALCDFSKKVLKMDDTGAMFTVLGAGVAWEEVNQLRDPLNKYDVQDVYACLLGGLAYVMVDHFPIHWDGKKWIATLEF